MNYTAAITEEIQEKAQVGDKTRSNYFVVQKGSVIDSANLVFIYIT